LSKEKPATVSFAMAGNIELCMILKQLLEVIQLCA
jgi:hypothetical protein